MPMTRRTLAGAISLPFVASSLEARQRPPVPIILVHGNGSCAAFWMGFVWRLEANGYPSDLIHPLDFAQPIARSSGLDVDDASATPGRSSTADQLSELTAAIARVRAATGAQKVILIGHSRAGNAIRNYLWTAGADAVERVVLCATTTNGLVAVEQTLQRNEFNRAGAFLGKLNARATDVPPGLPTLSIRSDDNDLWFQSDGRFIGMPGRPTGIGPAAPDVRGAENLVLPGVDHKQAALGAAAFAAIHRFVTGVAPGVIDPPAEPRPMLDGIVTGFRDGAPSNFPVTGAQVEVFELSSQTGERLGPAVHARITAGEGLWGPYQARPGVPLEFVVRVQGLPVTHIVRPPFPRSTNLVRLTPAIPSPEERVGAGLLVIRRPRGLTGAGRDSVLANGAPPQPRADNVYRFWLDPTERVPGIAAHAVAVGSGSVTVTANAETVVVRARPLGEGIVVAEFHS